MYNRRFNFKKKKISNFNFPYSEHIKINNISSNVNNNEFDNEKGILSQNRINSFNNKNINNNIKNDSINNNTLNCNDKYNYKRNSNKKNNNINFNNFNYREKNYNKFINKKRFTENNNNINYHHFKKNNICYISFYKNEILENLNNKNIIIIRGFTGCGKSTQIPQYIYNNNQNKKILVTQPRRISTISIANRIAKEMGFKLGDIIGYQVSMESKISDNTRIFIKTNGIFFEELIHNKSFQYSYIILDEIHESDIYTELLLSFFKHYFSTNDKINFKLIIMSASIDINNFLNYFKIDKIKNDIISIIDIKYTSKYKIYEHNLKQIYEILIDNKYVSEDLKENLENIYLNMDNSIKFDKLFLYKKPIFIKELCLFVIGILETIEMECKYDNSGVLIFLPGIEQIKYLNNYIINYRKETNRLNIFNIIFLHSIYNFKEQNKIFYNNNESINLILATNIAETSITIPKLNFVIDFCLVKQKNYDEEKDINYLELNWYSKTNYIQRKGRIGRISEGYYLQLIPQKLFEQLDILPKSEILSQTLEIPILKLFLYTNNFDSSVNIIENCINVPSKKAINNSFDILENLGAVIKNNKIYKNDNSNDINYINKNKFDYTLTNVGSIYTELPLELKYSRLIVISYVLGNINLGITLASILSQEKSIFINSFNNYERYLIKLKYSEDKQNDFIIIYNLYKEWFSKFKNFNNNEDISKFDYINLNEKTELKNYLYKNYLDIYTLHQILKTELLLKQKLTNLNLYNSNFDDYENNITFDKDKLLILNTILVGAFYNQIYSPQYQYLNVIGSNIIKDVNTDEKLYTLYIEFNNEKKELDEALNKLIGIKNYELLYLHKYKSNINIKFKNFEDLKKLLLSVYYDIDINDNKKYYYLDYFDEYNNIKSLKFVKNFEYYYDLKYFIDCNNQEIFPNKESINYINIYSNFEKLRNSKIITNDFLFKSYTKEPLTKIYNIYSKNTSIVSTDMVNLIILVFAPKYNLIKNNEFENEYKNIIINNINIEFDYIITNYQILLINKLRILINNIIDFGLDKEKKFKYNKESVENLENKLESKLFDDFIKNEEYTKMYKEIKRQIFFLLNNAKLIRNLKRNLYVDVYNYTYGIKNEKIKYFTNNNIIINNKYFGLNIRKLRKNPFNGYIIEINKLKKIEKERDFLQIIQPLNNIKEYYLDVNEINNFIDKHNLRIKDLYSNYNEVLEFIKDLLFYNTSYILCSICNSEICPINKDLLVIDDNTIKYNPSYFTSVKKTSDYISSYKYNIDMFDLFRTKNIEHKNFLYCKNEHIIGYTKITDTKYYIYVNGNISIKYPDLTVQNIYVNNIFEVFDNIKDRTDKINEIKLKENFKKKIKCILCDITIKSYYEFIKHLNGSNHKTNMCLLLKEIL